MLGRLLDNLVGNPAAKVTQGAAKEIPENTGKAIRPQPGTPN